MRILLVSMPDTADYIDYISRMPNLAIASLAGNLSGHDIKILDLVVHKPNIRKPVTDIIKDFRPQIVGLSAMSFQFDTLLRVGRYIRSLDKNITIITGGYHATLMAKDNSSEKWLDELDFIVRGEGEETFQELVNAIERNDGAYDGIPGLSYRSGKQWIHNDERPLLELAKINLPLRSARLSQKFFFATWSMDVVETSRGCPFHCKFCSIMHMYGGVFRKFTPERVIADLKNIRAQGTNAVFFSDDNITFDIEHFESICDAIVANGLNEMNFVTQVTAVGIADNPQLVAKMEKANFRIVFVGFESMEPKYLKGMKKPTSPEKNRRAAELLRKHNIGIIAGCVVGYPEDNWDSITRQYKMIKELKPDAIYAQYLTPYPRTRVREELQAEDLITNNDFSRYDGFTCNIRTRHLSEQDLFRCLKSLTLRKMFDPRMIYVNTWRKIFPLSLVLTISLKCVLDNIYHVLSGKQKGKYLDI
jgi:anaerobic magnesium-protoporphyrin IX monomethyl ester cyclase